MMKKIVLMLLCVVFAKMAMAQATRLFTADDKTMIANPERGFIGKVYPVWTEPQPSITRALKQSDCDRVKGKKYTVIGMRYVLYPWRTTDLSPEILAQIKADCDLARKNGLKLNVDFAYNYAWGYYDNVKKLSDAPEEWVLRHIEQLTTNGGANDGPLLVSNDVIAYWNVGFIGCWGEEHHSSNNLLYAPSPDVYATMNTATYNIWNALLSKIPANRMISTRYCAFKKQFANNIPMDDKTTGDIARIGIHDYSFASNVDNMGSFQYYAGGGLKRVKALRTYCANECKYTVSAGEPYGSDPAFPKQQYGDSVIAEMRYFDLDFYNGEFDEVAAKAVTLDKWQKQGLLDSMKNFIGYRLNLLSAAAPESILPGANGRLNFRIENRGWGKLFNPRPVNLLLCRKDGNSYAEKYTIKTDINPRLWYSETQKDESIAFTMPAEAPEGTYDLLLQLPDEYESLAGNPAYSVRFATKYNGTDIWNPELGANLIGQINVGKTSGTGMIEKSGQTIDVYPNPVDVSGQLTIKSGSDKNSSVVISDMQGRKVYGQTFQSQLTVCPADINMNRGFYLFKVVTENEESDYKLVVL